MSNLAELVVGHGVGSHEIVERVDHALYFVERDLAVFVDVVETPKPANAVVKRAAQQHGQDHEKLFEIDLSDVSASKALERYAIVDLLFQSRKQVPCVELCGSTRE